MRKLLMVAIATLSLVACGAPSTTDFVQKAAMSDMYEVEAGKIASQKGQSAPVKGFGQMMVDAHSKTTEELQRHRCERKDQGRSAYQARRQISKADR